MTAPHASDELIPRVHSRALIAKFEDETPRNGRHPLDRNLATSPGSLEAALHAPGGGALTIKRVIDDWGRTPQPYEQDGALIYPAAYQQILKGYPAINYSAQDIVYAPRSGISPARGPDGCRFDRDDR